MKQRKRERQRSGGLKGSQDSPQVVRGRLKSLGFLENRVKDVWYGEWQGYRKASELVGYKPSLSLKPFLFLPIFTGQSRYHRIGSLVPMIPGLAESLKIF